MAIGSSVHPRTVRDVMRRDVLTIQPDATARDLARLLWFNEISGVPVVENGRVVGLVSATDILWLADRMEPRDGAVDFPGWEGLDRFTVRDLMTPDVFSVAPETRIDELRAFFARSGVHRAPVLAEGRLVGIVSLSDLLGIIAAVGRWGSPIPGGES